MSSASATGPALSDARVLFPGAGDQVLEGLLEWPEAGPGEGKARRVLGGVVIAHPYPPHGATMTQPVVYRIGRASRRRGLATLRFNFRGVEGSSGTFSGTEEHRDVEAAAAFLSNRLTVAGCGSKFAADDRPPEGHGAGSCPAAPPIALAGYSFGSVMAARAAAGSIPVRALVLVGFAVSWEGTPADTYTRLARFRGPVLAVCAEDDELGYPEDVEGVLAQLGLDFSLSVVRGAGHFLEGKHREVAELAASFLERNLGTRE